MLLRLLACLLCALSAAAAHAVIITGNFSAYQDRIIWMGAEYPGDRSPITGSFFIDTGRFDGSGSYWNVDPDAIGFSVTRIDSGGIPVEDSIGFQTLALDNAAGPDSLIATTYYPKGFGSELHLFGDLFPVVWTDPHSPTVDLANSFLYQGYIRDVTYVGTYYAFTSVTLNVAQAVPAPASLGLMTLALGIMGGLRWRRNPP